MYTKRLDPNFVLDQYFSAIKEKTTYPPYNLTKLDELNQFELQLAVAGFDLEDLHVERDGNLLSIKGSKSAITVYEHRGIAERDFETRFRITDETDILGVVLQGGILTISCQVNIPERLKPKKFEITHGEELSSGFVEKPKELLTEDE